MQKCHKVQRGIPPTKFYTIPAKVNQVIYTSYPFSVPNIKAPAKNFIVLRYPANKASMYKMPKIAKGRNSVKIYEIPPNVTQEINISFPICVPNIKTLEQIVFEISC